MATKLLLETCTTSALSFVYIVFTSAVCLILTLGSLGPSTYKSNVQNVAIHSDEFFNGDSEIIGTSERMARLHNELVFWVQFTSQEKIGFGDDIPVRLKIVGCMEVEGEYCSGDEIMIASRDVEYSYECKLGNKDCSPIVVFVINDIKYPHYSINVSPQKDNSVEIRKELLGSNIRIGFTYMLPGFTYIQLVYRYGFIMLDLIALITFVSLIRLRKLTWKELHTEQKWMIMIFISLIAFNNPFLILQYFSSLLMFKTIGIILQGFYLGTLLLSILVFVNSMYERGKKTILKFYVPKFVLVISIMTLYITLSLYYTTNVYKDPTFNLTSDFRYLELIQWIAVSLSFLYIFVLGYYIFRILSSWRKLPRRFSIKFRIVGTMTVVMFTVVILYLALLSFFGKMNSSVVLMGVHVTLNMYPLLLAILFAPSKELMDIYI